MGVDDLPSGHYYFEIKNRREEGEFEMVKCANVF